jgi:hypothetical protein
VKLLLGEVVCFGRRGNLAGIAAFMRALGSTGEPERDSCSVVQHSFEVMMSVKKSGKRTRGGQKMIQRVVDTVLIFHVG